MSWGRRKNGHWTHKPGAKRKGIAALLTKLGWPCRPEDVRREFVSSNQRSAGACIWSAQTERGEVLGVDTMTETLKHNDTAALIYSCGDTWMWPSP